MEHSLLQLPADHCTDDTSYIDLFHITFLTQLESDQVFASHDLLAIMIVRIFSSLEFSFFFRLAQDTFYMHIKNNQHGKT